MSTFHWVVHIVPHLSTLRSTWQVVYIAGTTLGMRSSSMHIYKHLLRAGLLNTHNINCIPPTHTHPHTPIHTLTPIPTGWFCTGIHKCLRRNWI